MFGHAQLKHKYPREKFVLRVALACESAWSARKCCVCEPQHEQIYEFTSQRTFEIQIKSRHNQSAGEEGEVNKY